MLKYNLLHPHTIHRKYININIDSHFESPCIFIKHIRVFLSFFKKLFSDNKHEVEKLTRALNNVKVFIKLFKKYIFYLLNNIKL